METTLKKLIDEINKFNIVYFLIKFIIILKIE